MILHVICGYPSKSQGTYADFNQADFKAYKFVKAVKGKDFNGYAVLRQADTEYRIENNVQGRMRAMTLAGRMLAGKILHQLNLPAAAIVPVPASDHVDYGADFTGSRLAQAISTAFPAFQAFPNISFSEVMEKAADGGTRDPAVLLPYMQLHGELPDLPIVLLDDVTSTCGHLKAAARLLRNAGHPVSGAVCVAQTVWERPENMFAIPPRETVIDSWPGDDPCLF